MGRLCGKKWESLRYRRQHSATGELLHQSRGRGGISVGLLRIFINILGYESKRRDKTPPQEQEEAVRYATFAIISGQPAPKYHTHKGVHTNRLTAREREHWFLQRFSHF